MITTRKNERQEVTIGEFPIIIRIKEIDNKCCVELSHIVDSLSQESVEVESIEIARSFDVYSLECSIWLEISSLCEMLSLSLDDLLLLTSDGEGGRQALFSFHLNIFLNNVQLEL